MTREDIIRMAREIGLKFRENNNEIYSPDCDGVHIDEMQHFAQLVAAAERENWPAEMKAMERQVEILTDELANAKAAEREACAKICDAEVDMWGTYDADVEDVAREIRKRGQQ